MCNKLLFIIAYIQYNIIGTIIVLVYAHMVILYTNAICRNLEDLAIAHLILS